MTKSNTFLFLFLPVVILIVTTTGLAHASSIILYSSTNGDSGTIEELTEDSPALNSSLLGVGRYCATYGIWGLYTGASYTGLAKAANFFNNGPPYDWCYPLASPFLGNIVSARRIGTPSGSTGARTYVQENWVGAHNDFYYNKYGGNEFSNITVPISSLAIDGGMPIKLYAAPNYEGHSVCLQDVNGVGVFVDSLTQYGLWSVGSLVLGTCNDPPNPIIPPTPIEYNVEFVGKLILTPVDNNSSDNSARANSVRLVL